jgi:hypothetical protein
MNTIQTNSNYVVFKKILSVHTEDRDISKWPNSNLFEITAPVEYKNVVSLRLSDIQVPSSYYVFSDSNQNTKISFKVVPLHTLGSGLNPTTFVNRSYINGMKLLQSPAITVTIEEGTYTPQELAARLQQLFNDAVADYMGSTTTEFKNFTITYNTITHKFEFENNKDGFNLIFNKPEYYEHCANSSYYDNYTNWGLGSYLGFNKCLYKSVDNIIISENSENVYGDSYIYMELDYFNSMDEIAPYTEKSSASYNPKYSGKHNAAFAKIPLFLTGYSVYSTKETYLNNIFFSDPPLERIQKFKFKLRYHDGRLVDFHNANYTFTIEITILKPDTIKPAIKVNSSNYNL